MRFSQYVFHWLEPTFSEYVLHLLIASVHCSLPTWPTEPPPPVPQPPLPDPSCYLEQTLGSLPETKTSTQSSLRNARRIWDMGRAHNPELSYSA